MFCDEFGISFRDRLATTWGQRGQTPVLRRRDKRRGLSCFCGLTTSGKIYTVYFRCSIDGTCVVTALRYIRRYLKGPVIIIWDQLAAHNGPQMRQYLMSDRQIEVETLPAYSPELNPEEYCHGYAKERMRNTLAESVDELLQCIEHEFKKIRRRPKLIESFFAHAKIPLTVSLSS
jgi:transposase